MLESDLKGARNSLMVPSIPSPGSSGGSPTSGYTRRSPTLGTDGIPLGPRITFGAPRHSRFSTISPHTSAMAGTGHGRNYSETSVPAPDGTPVKGSRLPKAFAVSEDARPSSLPTPANTPANTPASAKTTQHTSPPRSESQASTRALRSQAEDLKNRISYIQERVREDSIKRQSFQQSPRPSLDYQDRAVLEQVREVESTVVEQEAVIAHLEEKKGIVANDPRAEWQRVLDRDEGDNTESGSEESDDEEFRSVLEEQFVDEDEPVAMNGAHEDRADAFDYENFILHSAMSGFYGNVLGERQSSLSGSSSGSTEKGLGGSDFDEDELSPGGRGSMGSKKSMTSFVTAAEESNSEFEEDSEEDAAWPMPPSNRGSGGTEETPTRSHFRVSGGSSRPRQRPVSTIFTAMITDDGGGLAGLQEDDQVLLYSLAEAVRHACLQLHSDVSRQQEDSEWRERLEAARELLSGDVDGR